MITIRKMIDSGSLWLLAACILPLCLAIPALCTAASSADLAQANHLLLASGGLTADPPEIFFPKPPPPPPPARA